MSEAKKVELSFAELRALKEIQKLIEKAIKINSDELGFYILDDELNIVKESIERKLRDKIKYMVEE